MSVERRRQSVPGALPALGDAARELVARRPRGDELELYEKRGRSRRFTIAPEGESFAQATEAGWAARGGDQRGSYFVTGTGGPPPRLDAAGRERSGAPIRLPLPFAPSSWTPPAELDAPLVTENEGFALLAGIARELARELPGAVARRLAFEDGASSSALLSSRGIDVSSRGRACSLRIEAELPNAGQGTVRVEAEFVARTAAELKPLGVARRLADRLLALRPEANAPSAGELVLAPPLAARLLEALAPRLVGLDAPAAMAAMAAMAETAQNDNRDELEGRAGSRLLSIVDDGGDLRGALAAAYDGEGVPCRPQPLLIEGRFVAPLLAWWQSANPNAATGVSLRPGWRDLPRPGPTQLFIAPAPAVSVAELVGSIAAGAYLLAAESGVRISADGAGFTVAVSGFALERGRATGGLGPCTLHGRFDSLLCGVRAVGRDLAFVPGRALFGSPTLVVSGLVLERAAG